MAKRERERERSGRKLRKKKEENIEEEIDDDYVLGTCGVIRGEMEWWIFFLCFCIALIRSQSYHPHAEKLKFPWLPAYHGYFVVVSSIISFLFTQNTHHG